MWNLNSLSLERKDKILSTVDFRYFRFPPPTTHTHSHKKILVTGAAFLILNLSNGTFSFHKNRIEGEVVDFGLHVVNSSISPH